MLLRLFALLAVPFAAGAVLAADPPAPLAPYFKPPKELATAFGGYRSPLRFDDGTEVTDASAWPRRRAEILKYWHGQMGAWPALIERPKVELGPKEDRDGVAQYRLKIETAPGRTVDDAYLLVPPGKGPFPAVVVVFYEADTAIGRGKTEFRDFAVRLAHRGFVALALGGDPNTYYPTKEACRIQPLSFHAYEAANCHTALAQMPNVDPARIGVVGHSYGGKWAMFAAALHDKFACGAWSDPGIVFDEGRPNVNYWEPWYLGFDPALARQRDRGVPSEKNPRTGPYKRIVADKRDLTDLHALVAPRPFLVSGGAEDPPERWAALNHAVAVNRLLGAENRVAMTNRKAHAPDAASNELLYLFFESALGRKK